MLADTLKMINEAEEKADNILAKANETVQTIEKQTYQAIEDLATTTDTEIAQAIAKLPPLPSITTPNFTIKVPAEKMQAAVDYIMKAITEYAGQ